MYGSIPVSYTHLDVYKRQVFDAMTHAFFTLSVGIGAMEIFGSYQKREHSIPGEAKNIVILDTFVALMAGFIIIPACFAYGVQPDAGPVSYTHLDVYKRQDQSGRCPG